MHPSHRPARGQQRRVRAYAGSADSYAMFNLLTGPHLLDRVEALLRAHRERLFPPTESLSMFLAQVLSADGSCQQVVNDAMVKRVIGGMKPGSTDTGGYCKARARLPVSMVSTLARGRWDCGQGRPLLVALAQPSGASGRRCHGDTARHAGESGRLPAVEQSEARTGLSHLPGSGAAVPGWRRLA